MKNGLLPVVRFLPVATALPSLQDNTADLDRLRRALTPGLDGRHLLVPWARMGVVAERFRASGFAGIAVINDLPYGCELVDFLGQAPRQAAGLALDLGTTHLEASLVDLVTGTVLAQGHAPNPQSEHGADILSRIHFAVKGEGLALLRQEVVAAINGLAVELAGRAGIMAAEIWALAVAGNTTMSHFLLGLSPYHLCREPYIPQANNPDPCLAAELGLTLHPAARVWVLPGVGSYFGGDLVAGILATDLDQAEQTSMLIDVGTNAEVVIGNREWLIACAGAAGPALEGGVARMGMLAGPGAIEHVVFAPENGALSYTTIAHEPPRGICGSGVIDLVAGLYLARLIDSRGRFRPQAMGDRLVAGPDGPAFVVAPASEAAGQAPVLLGQVDLDALMRSKAAMYAILTTIMHQVGLGFAQLERIYVAGAFGRHIDPRQAVVIGMLPDLPLETYKPAGNSSLAGAQRMLLDSTVRARCQAVVRKITYLELNVNQEFMERFSGCRFIPHTDHRLFPSVPHFGQD
jgi:uncharacterized 2Fe-2S/4Fe-4S cluster protein (DUF4445 family)